MIPIQGAPPPAAVVATPKRPAAARSSAFGVPDPEPAAAEAAGTGAAPEAALAGMLALQEGAAVNGAATAASGSAARDRQARRRGRDLLEALAALHCAVLAGPPDAASLASLAALAAPSAEAADPALRRIVADIRLRAHVELARYGVG
jgi:hypothetical protein